MKASTKMVINDPSKFGMLAEAVKKDMTQAAKETVNIASALTSKKSKKNIAENFNKRNNFTISNVGFTPMSESAGCAIHQIQASTGIDEKASYMARQEEGGDREPRQGSTLAMPTDNARGGSFGNRVQKGFMVKDIRKKRGRVHGKSSARKNGGRMRTSVTEINKNGNITKRKKKYFTATSHTAKSNLVSRAYIAHKHKLFIPMGGRGDQRNLHRVYDLRFIGTGKNRSVEFKTQMLYNFTRKKTRTRPRPWLSTAAREVRKDMQKIFNSQMRKIENKG